MYTKEQIIKLINDEGCFADNFIIDAFIRNYKIEAIYEDENGVEFYDDLGYDKIRNGIVNKIKPEIPEYKTEIQNVIDNETENIEIQNFEETQEKTEVQKQDEINSEQTISNEFIEPSFIEENIQTKVEQEVQQAVKNYEDFSKNQTQAQDTKSFTLDITNKTLATLANSIAKKITLEISQYLKNSINPQNIIEDDNLKKDNKILASKLEEVISDNKILIKKIQQLEEEEKETSYYKVFGNIYIKK